MHIAADQHRGNPRWKLLFSLHERLQAPVQLPLVQLHRLN
jgi:hypothetical protein